MSKQSLACFFLLGPLILAGSWYLILRSVDGRGGGSLGSYARGYGGLLRSGPFWSFTLGFGCLQGIFFAMLACALTAAAGNGQAKRKFAKNNARLDPLHNDSP